MLSQCISFFLASSIAVSQCKHNCYFHFGVSCHFPAASAEANYWESLIMRLGSLSFAHPQLILEALSQEYCPEIAEAMDPY